jgi:hypothetical protein
MKCVARWSGVLACGGVLLLTLGVVLLPQHRLLADEGGVGEPKACALDFVCDNGTPEKCFWNQNLSRCSRNGDPDGNGGTLSDVCSTTSNPDCKDCGCLPYRAGDGMPWSCHCV